MRINKSFCHTVGFISFGLTLASFHLLSGCGGIQSDALPIEFSPASGAVGTVITATGYDFSTVQSFTVGGTTGVVVKATSREFMGMVMPGTSSGTLSITTSSGQISYPTSFTVSATGVPTTQLAKQSVSNSLGASALGISVAISANKNTIFAGGQQDYSNLGAAWSFIRSGVSSWSQESKLTPSNTYGQAKFGAASAVSADGNTVIIGGPIDSDLGGAAWVYTKSNGEWTQQAKLVGTGNVGDAAFGTSVALSADGNTALVGGHSDNSNQGATWVFTRSGSTWTQQGSKLLGTGVVSFSRQGFAVALSADGNTALVGGWADNSINGAAWVFTRSGGTWTQQGSKLVATGNVGVANVGRSVALSADGNTAILGGAADNGVNGAVWVFTRSGTTWTQEGSKLVGTGNTGAAIQGWSVAISADGNVALVGAVADNSSAGAVWFFTRSNGTWSQYGSKIVGSGVMGAARFGESVSLAPDATAAVVGAASDASSLGAFWTFVQ